MEQKSPAVALAIPAIWIAFAATYVYVTADYPDPETVRFPYTIAVVLTICFTIIFVRDAVDAWSKGWRPGLPANIRSWLAGRFRDKTANPFYLVVLTVAYALALPELNVLATTFLYVTSLRFVFRNMSLRLAFYDILGVAGLYLVFHDLLRIQLPSGPIEALLSGLFNVFSL